MVPMRAGEANGQDTVSVVTHFFYQPRSNPNQRTADKRWFLCRCASSWCLSNLAAQIQPSGDNAGLNIERCGEMKQKLRRGVKKSQRVSGLEAKRLKSLLNLHLFNCKRYHLHKAVFLNTSDKIK
ncbi:hypothetical protein PoB_003340500 [Plakobranchus ocellatus]|uniref:Uncharacterized protein n=1 Tax=Plakobranchus ocellatus TaxID=259542 RepID=A0AAV4AJA1_9GAST|nr:hypothetical protein PoB_003340500 [Plakobranchus ocellatus]